MPSTFRPVAIGGVGGSGTRVIADILIRLGFYLQFREIWKEEIQRAFSGEKTAQVALDDAKVRGDELLRRFEQTYQGVALP